MPLDFTAIDFETANGSPASVCQVGLARVRDGVVVESTGWLIRPPAGHDAFQSGNVRIHGITPDRIVDAPDWPSQLGRLLAFLGDDVLAAHSATFDMRVLRAASEATGCALGTFSSVCSLQVARKTYDLPSYRLPAAATAAGHPDFAHHEATADALACARIVVDAAARAGAADVADLAERLGIRLGATQPVASRTRVA